MKRRGDGRRGTTLAEAVVVVTILGIMVGIGAPRLRASLDRSAARSAVQEAGLLFSRARRLALSRRSAVAVRIDAARGVVSIESDGRRLQERDLGVRYGIGLRTTRDSMSYDARGLGFGAANLTLVMSRGSVAESLTVSRLGRTR